MNIKSQPDCEAPRGRKAWLIEEIKEIRAAFVYLLFSLSLLSTMKALVLAQQGIDEFLHCYLVALVQALALSKLVVLAQKLPLMDKWKQKPLLYAVFYQAVVMTVLINIGSSIEEKIFVHHPSVSPHPVILLLTHQVVLLIIFIVLFTARGLNNRLGDGVLQKIFFGDR
jgi:hypothetical protein